jgi:peroxiredoxin
MARFLRFLSLSLVLIFMAVPAVSAQDKVGVGDTAPALSLSNQDGVQMSLETLTGEKGLVVAFVRSLDWCPYCKSQVMELAKNAQQIEEHGYNVAIVCYDSPETLKTFADKFDVDLNLLSDTGSKTIQAYGILNEEFDADHFAYGVPHPHIYILSRDGIVLQMLAEEGYKERPSIESIVESLSTP